MAGTVLAPPGIPALLTLPPFLVLAGAKPNGGSNARRQCDRAVPRPGKPPAREHRRARPPAAARLGGPCRRSIPGPRGAALSDRRRGAAVERPPDGRRPVEHRAPGQRQPVGPGIGLSMRPATPGRVCHRGAPTAARLARSSSSSSFVLDLGKIIQDRLPSPRGPALGQKPGSGVGQGGFGAAFHSLETLCGPAGKFRVGIVDRGFQVGASDLAKGHQLGRRFFPGPERAGTEEPNRAGKLGLSGPRKGFACERIRAGRDRRS